MLSAIQATKSRVNKRIAILPEQVNEAAELEYLYCIKPHYVSGIEPNPQMQSRQMTSRLTNYYIGLQIAFVLVSWLANGATGIYFSNIWTQMLFIETLILFANSFLVYRTFYGSKENISQKPLYFSLLLTALVFIGQSITIIWNGFVVYQVPFHVAFLFGFVYSIYLLITLSKGADNTTANRAFVK